MWLAMVRLTSPASTSLPMPRPGSALSFAITVRSRLPWRTSSSITRSGVPTPMNPPIMSVAPSGIIATASFTETVCMAGCPFADGQNDTEAGRGHELYLGSAGNTRRQCIGHAQCVGRNATEFLRGAYPSRKAGIPDQVGPGFFRDMRRVR